MLNKSPKKQGFSCNSLFLNMLRMLRDCYELRNRKTPYKSTMLRMLRMLRDFLAISTLHSGLRG